MGLPAGLTKAQVSEWMRGLAAKKLGTEAGRESLRKAGEKGGARRMTSMSKRARRAVARKAALARWRRRER